MEKELIIFVSGSFHNSWCWENFINYFNKVDEKYKIVAFDYERNEKTKISDYVNQLAKVIAENRKKVTKINIISHSLGTAIVQHYIKINSHDIEKCVFLSPIPPRHTAVQILKAQKKMGNKSREEVLFSNRIEQSELNKYKSLLVEESLNVKLGVMETVMPKDFKCNTKFLVVGSHNDYCMPLSASIKTAEFFRCNMVILENLCHDMMLDPQWEEVAEYCYKFINGNCFK